MSRSEPDPGDDPVARASMALAVSAFPWERTAIGARDAWPDRMAGIVDAAANSLLPMASFWGPTGIALFNDGFARLVPDAPVRLGQPVDVGWPEVADLVGTALAGRSASAAGRFGAGPSGPWGMAASPILDRAGAVIGALLVGSPCAAQGRSAAAAAPAPQGASWSADAAGSLAWLSPRWSALTGLSGVEGLGAGWLGTVHPEDRARTADIWAGSIASGRPYEVEHRIRTGDGSFRWMRSRAAPHREPAGGVTSWQGTTEPLERRKVVENRQTLLLDLSDRFRSAAEGHDIMGIATSALGREIGAARVIYAEIDLAHHAAALEVEWVAGAEAAVKPARSMPLDALALGRSGDFEAGLTIVGSDAAGAALAVPLVRDGRLRALFHVAAGSARVWLPDEIALVEDVAARSWDALDRIAAAAVLRRNQARQSFLLVLGDRLRESVDFAEIAETTSEALGRQLHVARAAYGEVSARGDGLVFQNGWSDGTTAPLAGTVAFADIGVRHVADLERGLTTVFDVGPERGSPVPALTRGLQTAIAVPLIRDGRLRAVLTLGRADHHRWTAEEIALVGEVAARMWETLERARAEAALRDLNASLESHVERRTAELASSEARFRTLFENAPAAIVLIRAAPDGRMTFEAANAAAELSMGRSAAEIVGRDVAEVVGPGDPLPERCRACAATGLPVQFETSAEVNGAARSAESVLAPLAIEGDEGQILIGISRDITAQRSAEEQLRQAQKMEAIGQLTGGIAHDFNNLLTGIIGSLALMQKRVSQGRPEMIERYAGLAMTSANRAAALTHRLLAFSRRQPLEAKVVDANALVGSMDDLLRRTLGESIALRCVETAGLWPTLCDPHQLENALLNLAINARDAMPEGGRLTIETANAVLDEGYVAHEPGVVPGDYVALSVSDTGTGMSPEVMIRAFDPFFTTKPIGQGTGLGLSMIYGFVKQSGGHIKIYSEPGRGTSIKMFLPRSGTVDDADLPETATAAVRAKRGETVLLVEDDDTVRDLVLEVLRDLGYTALQAPDGPTGLALVRSSHRIDLLVTDVGLPGMNGRQLAEQARRERPSLKVLFMTGYAENAAFGDGHLAPDMQMMTKPFAVDALAHRIRDMILRR